MDRPHCGRFLAVPNPAGTCVSTGRWLRAAPRSPRRRPSRFFFPVLPATLRWFLPLQKCPSECRRDPCRTQCPCQPDPIPGRRSDAHGGCSVGGCGGLRGRRHFRASARGQRTHPSRLGRRPGRMPAARWIRRTCGCSRSTTSAPTAASMRRSTPPTRPTRSRCCWTRWASTRCKPSSAIPTARWSACSSPRAIRAPAQAGRGQRRASRASLRRAWRALQRKAVALGQLQCADAQGLSLARQFAMLSYRTPEEFGERFDAPPRSSTAACAWPPRITWTRPARSTSRAPGHRLPAPVRIHRPAPRRSLERPRADHRWSRWKATGWCRCPTRSRWSKAWAARPAARAALALRPRRLPQGNRPHRRILAGRLRGVCAGETA
jgi:hypothetical protein